MIGATQPELCQVRSRTDLPCGSPATATILGIRFCERCAREQERYFAVGELTRVSRGESGGAARGAGYAARACRPGRPAQPRGDCRVSVAGSAKLSLPLIVARSPYSRR